MVCIKHGIMKVRKKRLEVCPCKPLLQRLLLWTDPGVAPAVLDGLGGDVDPRPIGEAHGVELVDVVRLFDAISIPFECILAEEALVVRLERANNSGIHRLDPRREVWRQEEHLDIGIDLTIELVRRAIVTKQDNFTPEYFHFLVDER